ncbi:MAG: DegV family protein [Chloroflexota bacterium]
MPNKVAILTDSTAYLPPELLKQYNITVVPLSVIWGEQSYQDGVDIQPGEFYTRLKESKVTPTTSQATVGAMQVAFQSLLERGYDVLGMFISSGISGTVQSAIQARDMMPEAAHAQRIAIVDSCLTTMALGWSVLTVARAAHAGENMAACVRVAENARDHSGVIFVVDTLEYLRRGGRVSGGQAVLGNVLQIKPILEMRNGKIESVEKVRTKRKAIERMLELVDEKMGGQRPVRIAVTHANSEVEATSVLEMAKARFNPVEAFCAPLSPVIGTHAGPGTIVLNYMSGIA